MGSSPLFSVSVILFALFSVLFFGWVKEFNYCCCSYSSIFHSVPDVFMFLALQTHEVAFSWPLR